MQLLLASSKIVSDTGVIAIITFSLRMMRVSLLGNTRTGLCMCNFLSALSSMLGYLQLII
ncbi:hypothetical protein BDR04DRAFT_320604 [Suillus decipiens]|nr:hypothetical protein BDR04DRAFT_320604 [Suillus decipiens]